MYPGRSGKMKAGNTNGSSADKECLQLLGDNGGGTTDLQVGKPAKGETHQQTRGLLTLHGDKDEAIPTKMSRKMEKTKTSRARCPLARSPCLTVWCFLWGNILPCLEELPRQQGGTKGVFRSILCLCWCQRNKINHCCKAR